MSTKIDYDKEPFFYCRKCLSLRIMADDVADYCDECGSLDIVRSTNMSRWAKEYKKRYNIEYYGRESKKRND